MRKQLLFGALTAFGLSMSLQVTAQQQQFKCGNPEQLRKLYAENPQLELDQQKLVQKYNQARLEKADSNFVYIIPIVFHVVHEYGSENITDAQIYDQMDILNEDFRKLNADTAAVIPEFQALIADAKIEFRLATIDPYGNCTNGIEHIYSHQTNNGDDYSKHNQWHRDEYLNVWVVKTIGATPGVAGYAYYPSATVGGFFFADGIIILHDYIGSIGTGAGFSSRALTHEIGHYLGLAHTWGNTNDPTVSCGDDGVDDTPLTKGHDNCSNVYDSICTTGVIENVQNFMEYSYCSYMYTIGQANYMRNVLDQETSDRNNLYTDSNLMLTGADVISAPLCTPVSDFSVSKNTVCIGTNVVYKAAPWRAAVTSYQWSFPGGTPSTSTAPSPVVSYDNPGYYSATLTVTNAAGSDTKTLTNVVYASAEYSEVYGPGMEDFNQDPNFWISINPENNHAVFSKLPTLGINNSGCYRLQNYKDVSQAELYSDDFYYFNRLGNSKDYLISPSFNLSNTTGVSISFDYAYGTKATTAAEITEVLNVYSSKDCGNTWQLRETLTGAELITAGYVGSSDFYPASNNQWKNALFTYSANSTDTKTRFRFEFIASDLSSNLFIDNFNVSGTLGVSENEMATAINLSPNPVNSGSDISVEIEATDLDMTIQVVDLNGAVVSTTLVKATNGAQTVQIPMNVSQGYYILNAIQGNAKSTHKVVVF